jgi:hypothetical protein
MRRRKSSYMHGAADDVRDLSEHLVRHLRAMSSVTARTAGSRARQLR